MSQNGFNEFKRVTDRQLLGNAQQGLVNGRLAGVMLGGGQMRVFLQLSLPLGKVGTEIRNQPVFVISPDF